MKVLTFLCAKGGVGKTTTSYHAAVGLASRGYRVLLIDADGQGHATRMCGYEPAPAFYDLLVRNAAWRDVLQLVDGARCIPPSDNPGVLAVLPSNNETMLIPLRISDPYLLGRRLKEIDAVFDVTIIDTSPTPSLLNGAILMASSGIVYPSEMEFFSLKALEESIRDTTTFSEARAAAMLPPVRSVGIVPTMIRANVIEHQENLRMLKERYGDLVWSPLPQRITWPEAVMQRKSVFVYAPGSEASADAWALVDKVEEVIR